MDAERFAFDSSAGFPDPAALHAAGGVAYIGYLSRPRKSASWMHAKPLTRAAATTFREAGVELVSNYQYGKTADPNGEISDWRGGFDGGVHHGRLALAQHFAAGGPGWRPCYASIDDAPTDDEITSLVLPFVQGWATVWGAQWTGVYANTVVWEKLTSLGAPCHWLWQHNWGGSTSTHPDANLHQHPNDGEKISGIDVDRSTIVADDYGQWSRGGTDPDGDPHIAQPASAPAVRDRQPTPPPPPAPTPPAITWHSVDSPNWNSRGGDKPRLLVLHTEEGTGNADSLAQYLCNPAPGGDPSRAVSYHYTGDNSGVVVRVVDTDNASWSVSSANSVSINYCFAGSFADWSRQQWLDQMREGIRNAAFVLVGDAKKYGIPIVLLAPDQVRTGSGFCDHNAITIGWKVGSHYDVGPNFPWDVFWGDVRAYS